MRNGHTILELTIALLLGSMVVGTLLPAATRYRERARVLAAREEVAGLLAEARSAALGFGGASVVIEAAPWQAYVVIGDSIGRHVLIGDSAEVEVILPGGRTRADVYYDALGIGRVASQTLRFRAGNAEAGLTVSSFGRIRRW